MLDWGWTLENAARVAGWTLFVGMLAAIGACTGCWLWKKVSRS